MFNYKLSYYYVTSEPINTTGDRILFSTRTSRKVIITQYCLNILESGKIDEIPIDTLNKLIDVQIVVPTEEDELSSIINANKDHIDIDSKETLYQVIQPSMNCQLGCYYCGQKHQKFQIDNSILQKIKERTLQKLASNTFKNLHIGWFGGEPLMALQQMREMNNIFKQIAKEHNLTYSGRIATNGLSLKPNIYKELISEFNLTTIEITLDGVAEYHDKHRYTKEGKASFDIIFNNLKNIFKDESLNNANSRISIRCNVDEKNYEGVSPLIELLVKHNLHRKIAYFYPIGVYSWGNDAHKKSLTKEEFAKQEINWQIEMITKGFFAPSFTPSRKKSVCFAVSKTAELYDAEGNIYDCSEVSYVPAYENSSYKLGNLKDSVDINIGRSHLNRWNDDILDGKFPCTTCKMLPVCGGACPKSWNEDMRACPTAKFNIKDKLLVSYVLSQKTKEESIAKLNEVVELHPDKKWAKDLSDWMNF